MGLREMRILICDDHDLVRDAIAALLRRDDPAIVLALASRLDEAEAVLTGAETFDLALLDLHMPGMEGPSSATAMQAKYPQVRIVLMSGIAEDEDVLFAINGGLSGFLPKTLPGPSLINTLKLIASGESYFPVTVVKRLIAARTGQNVGVQAALTEREALVLSHLHAGDTNKEIAAVLKLEESTVKSYVRSLSSKFGAKNRTDLVVRSLSAAPPSSTSREHEAQRFVLARRAISL